ncbi:hypothetical protein PAPYR_118 [Paratrimastix pyriformis]|uniref:SCP domain-containing protein n=1 Tax=Paratrimastix pyriformis TaxID=342808 RepID=A0ABQ8UZW1_9EUKA|nr:hypothetical protein PAPYR_118 [Paratrimastix pyriformis]
MNRRDLAIVLMCLLCSVAALTSRNAVTLGAYMKPADETKVQSRLLNSTNILRTNSSVTPLTWDEKITALALRHSQEMAAAERISHSNFRERFQAIITIYPQWSMVGEVVGTNGGSSVEEVAQLAMGQWGNSTAHRQNLIDPKARYIGVGAHISAAREWWLTVITVGVSP